MPELFHLFSHTTSPKAEHALSAITSALVDTLHTDSDPANRIIAARSLIHVKERVSAAQLLPALEDTDSKVRYHIVKLLRQMADETVMQAFARHLDDIDPKVRQEVLEALVENRVSSVTAVPHLITLLNDSNPTIRMNAAEALGHTGSDEAVDKLIKHLNDPDSRVSLAAAQALGNLKAERAAQSLFDLARNEMTYYRLRHTAVKSLAAIAPPDIETMLFILLENPDLNTRHAVIKAIKRVSLTTQVEQLLDVADWHSSLVRPVCDALIRAGGKAVESVMIESLGHVREWMRALAVEVLGEIQSVTAVESILPLLMDDAQEVRILAANALGQIAHPRAVSMLKTTLHDPVWLVQVAASSALARIDTPEAKAASTDWREAQRDLPDRLDLDDDEPADVDLSDIL